MHWSLAVVIAVAACVSLPASGQGRDGLLLEYRLDGSAADTSGRGLNGNITGSAVFAPGRGARSLRFDGTPACVDSGTSLPELTATFTVECWVKPDAGQRPYADVFGNHVNEFAGFVLQQDGTQDNRYYFSYGTGRSWAYSRTIPLASDQWQHLAITKTPTHLSFYVNGLLVDRKPAPDPMKPSATHFMVGVGIVGPPRWFRGSVADVRVWDRAVKPALALPEAEVVPLFAEAAALECGPSTRWGIYRPGEAGGVRLALDPETVPEAISLLHATVEVVGPGGTARREIDLTRRAGFAALVPAPARAGLYRYASTARFAWRGKVYHLPVGRATLLRLGLAPAAPAITRTRRPTMPQSPSATSSSLDLLGDWLVTTDPDNRGLKGRWFDRPRRDAKPIAVPGVIQMVFPEYHGLAWYWRRFEVPDLPGGRRCLLRFGAVDYRCDLWVNGRPAGSHEGAEGPFEVDVTHLVATGKPNLVAVRVLNVANAVIDGLNLNNTPRRAKVIPYSAGASYDHGGIVGPVAVCVVPSAAITDLYARAEPATGQVTLFTTVRNRGSVPVRVRLEASVAPARAGAGIDAALTGKLLPVGETTLTTSLRVPNPNLWDLDRPFLYRVTARLVVGNQSDERSVRVGFRDFRFADGAFRLNGRRIILRSSHTVNAAPVTQQELGTDWFRKDVTLMKAMGFNCIRFIWGGGTSEQMDVCDEMGLMVYDEHAASNPMGDGPQMAERFDRSMSQTIIRDRNHPSVVMWGLLNETFNTPVFQHAVQMLPLVRSLDETRMVALNSGRWDGRRDVGSFCNPGSGGWECYLGDEGPGKGTTGMSGPGGYTELMGDVHAYPRVPHTADTMAWLRDLGAKTGPVFLSEYGIGSAVDLWRVTRRFEQMGAAGAEDARYYRAKLDAFMADWDRWKLAETFADPQAFFAESLRKVADQRTLGLNAIRANPKIVGHNVTGMMDHVNCGEGLFTLFRELKPGTTDALAEAFAPLRLCLFAEPANLYQGGSVRLEGVLANEDALKPGEYRVHVQVVAPDGSRTLDRIATVKVPISTPGREAPLAIPFLGETVKVTGPAGAYRFTATMLEGGAPTGGTALFHVADPTAQPAIPPGVTVWGSDPGLASWLHDRKTEAKSPDHEVIMVSSDPGDWGGLVERVRGGATAVFLDPGVFRSGDDPVARMPLANRGGLNTIFGWLYLKDEWAKRHPIFEGLPAGGLMDTLYYRELIPDQVFGGQDGLLEAVSGANKASQDYSSGLMLSVHQLGSGRIILNTLNIRGNMGRHPAADRLLVNLANYAAR